MVHKILGHDRYVIRDVDNCQLTQLPYDGVVEANRIRKWLSPLDATEINRTVEKCNTEGEEEEEEVEDETDPFQEDVTRPTEDDAELQDEDDFAGFDVSDLLTASDRGRSNVRSAEL